MILLSSSFNSFIQLMGVLVIFLFVLAVTYFTTKWIGGYQKVQMSGRNFKIVDSVRIAGGKCVQILKLGDVYLVVAVGKDEVTMLAKLTEDEIGLTEEQILSTMQSGKIGAEAGTQDTFQETLEKIRERFSKKQD